ncbi:Guanine nucleotide-binding protein-like 3 [Chamberlinius hualienensis]
MAKQYLKKQSKRTSCGRRYKIEKKIREHKKKLRREAKKNPKKRRTKDIGVPNSLPFKEQILKEAQDYKEKELELKRQLKAERKKSFAEKQQGLESSQDGKEENVESDSEVVVSRRPNLPTKLFTKFSKPFYREYQKVIQQADVILEVLDARDPLGSRCPQIEKAVADAGPNKRLVLILNKIDLIPSENVEEWLSYLRKEYPTVPFKCFTKPPSQKFSKNKRSKQRKVFSNKGLNFMCLGADLLIALLGNFCRNKSSESSIRVGVVGFPTVGKISVIRSLIRSALRSAGTNSDLGLLKEVELAKNVILIQSPGLVYANKEVKGAALRNAVNIKSFEDAIPAVEEILSRATVQKLTMHYRISTFSNTVEFLTNMARFCPMQTKGQPDVEAAAKFVVRGWTTGNTKYYTTLPENRKTLISAKLAKTMAEEFDVKSLQLSESSILSKFYNRNMIFANEAISLPASLPTEGTTEGFEFEEEDESTPMEEYSNNASLNTSKDLDENDDIKMTLTKSDVNTASEKLKEHHTLQTDLKTVQKKFNRDQAKRVKSVTNPDRLAAPINSSDDTYDFKVDYVSKNMNAV